MNGDLNERDMAAVLAYTEGHMQEVQRLDFERRLQQEPDLARIVEQMLSGDSILERWRAAAKPSEEARLLHFPRWILAATAAAAILGATVWFVAHDSNKDRVQLAAVSVEENFAQFQAAHPELAGIKADYLDSVVRGADVIESDASPAAQVEEQVRKLEQGRNAMALSGDVRSIVSSRFVLPIRLAYESSVLVVACSRFSPDASDAIKSKPAVRILVPEIVDADEVLRTALAKLRLHAGVHQLPGSSVGYDGGDLRYRNTYPHVLNCRPGTDVELRVFVAIARNASTVAGVRILADRLRGIDANEFESRVKQTRSALESSGFQVEELTVLNPEFKQ